MNPFARFRDNPGFEDVEVEGDLWAAVGKCHTRIAVLDERMRMALMFILPMLSFLVAVQLVCLGMLVK